MTFNLMHAGRGFESIAEVLRREEPDIICLQEAGRGRVEQPDRDLPLRIAETLGGYHVVSAGTLNLPAEQSCDVAIVSRFELGEATAFSLEPGGWVYAISARVMASGRPLRIYSVHTHATFKLDPHHVIESSTTRQEQVSALRDLVRAHDGDVIVAGDFNAPPALPEYATLREALADFGAGDGPSHPSFPAAAPILRLDYIFGRGDFRAREYRVIDADCSDHRPVVTELVREPSSRPNASPVERDDSLTDPDKP